MIKMRMGINRTVKQIFCLITVVAVTALSIFICTSFCYKGHRFIIIRKITPNKGFQRKYESLYEAQIFSKEYIELNCDVLKQKYTMDEQEYDKYVKKIQTSSKKIMDVYAMKYNIPEDELKSLMMPYKMDKKYSKDIFYEDKKDNIFALEKDIHEKYHIMMKWELYRNNYCIRQPYFKKDEIVNVCQGKYVSMLMCESSRNMLSNCGCRNLWLW